MNDCIDIYFAHHVKVLTAKINLPGIKKKLMHVEIKIQKTGKGILCRKSRLHNLCEVQCGSFVWELSSCQIKM